jgi:hypothetical protein
MIKPRPPSPPATPSAAQEGASEPKGTETVAAIGRDLKALFDSVAIEPVPDRFKALLDELERKSGKR